MAVGHIDASRNVSGFNYRQYSAFVDNLENVDNQFSQWLYAWALLQAKKVNDSAKRRTPVDTGTLKSSWLPPRIDLTGNSVRITFENTAEYSGWVEYGHAKPYKSGVGEGDADWVNGRFMITVPLQIFLDDVGSQFGTDFANWFTNQIQSL